MFGINPQCTYNFTNNKYISQEWATCYDCFSTESEGACLSCLAKCHSGHRVGPVKLSNFFCDCPKSGKCKRNSNPIPIVYPPNYREMDNISNFFEPNYFQQLIKDKTALQSKSNSKVTNINPSFVEINNTLALQMFSQFANSGVAVYSPFSLCYPLHMVYLGTSGRTRQELLNAMPLLNSLENSQLRSILTNLSNQLSDEMVTANAFYMQKGQKLRKSYVEFINSVGKMELVNFQADGPEIVSRINTWVAAKTNNLITKFVDSVDPSTKWILLNALYFKSNWKHKFEKGRTYPMKFHQAQFDNQLNVVDVIDTMAETMYQKNDFYYTENNAAQFLEMEYANNSPFRFGVILPKHRNYPRFPEKDEFNQIINNLSQQKVTVHLPKFRKESTIKLIPYLQNLGIQSLFKEFQAEFGNMNMPGGTKDSFVSDIIQKAVIVVDEEGTEAAAVTGFLCYQNCSAHKPEIVFKADHPFNYYIRDSNSNMVYFMGTYLGL